MGQNSQSRKCNTHLDPLKVYSFEDCAIQKGRNDI